jgi:flagellar biosynthetic protein FliR
MDWHLGILEGLHKSYQFIPFNAIIQWDERIHLLTNSIKSSFDLGMRLSAPIFMIGILTQFISGIINRLFPQIQIFFLNVPIQVLLGLFILLGSIFMFTQIFWDSFKEATAFLIRL